MCSVPLSRAFQPISTRIKKVNLSKDKRVKKIEQDGSLRYSGAIWSDNTNAFNEVTPWGVISMGGPYAIGIASYNNKLDEVPVFVLDAGVHSHIDLNLVGQEAVSGNGVAGCYAHATFVAGVIGAMDGTSRPNVALASAGASAFASSTHSLGYSASYAINGERRGHPWGAGGGWNDETVSVLPDWLQVNFSGQKTIDKVVVYSVQNNFSSPVEPTASMTFTNFGITAFYVEYWTGGAWAQIPGAAVSGNNLVMRTLNFPPISTDQIRVVVTGTADGFSRITEIEAFSVPTSAGVVGVRPGTPIHSIAFQDNPSSGCVPAATATDVVAGMERAKFRITERCQFQSDCRPGIANLSANSATLTTSGSAFSSALPNFTQQNSSTNYLGALLIHSAGNSQQPAQSVVVSPSSAADGYLRIGAIDQNGQQVRVINGYKGFANGVSFLGSIVNVLDDGTSSDRGSNYGSDIDLWAPRRAVRSTTTSNARGYGGGTSFSAPHIAGLAAKVRESVSNWTTASQLEQLVRAKSFSNQARDDAGLALTTAHAVPSTWRARPTVEILGPPVSRTPVDEHPSKPTLVFTQTATQNIPLKIQALGASNCSHAGTWNGYPWFSTAISSTTQNWNIHLDEPGAFVWTFTCSDPLDSSITNTASANITVVAAPPVLQINWFVNGIDKTDTNTPTQITRSAGATLGVFSLRFDAVNATACEIRAWRAGYAGWPTVNDPDSSTFEAVWYPPSASPGVAVANTGYNWGSVGLKKWPRKFRQQVR